MVDPRDGQGLPHIIDYARADRSPVWSHLWVVRNASRSPWAKWFRELDALHLRPHENFRWSVGRFEPLPRRFVKAFVDYRIRQINKATTGSELVAPAWLLRVWRPFRYALPPGRKLPPRRCVGRVNAEGRVEHYPSVTEAARHAGMTIVAVEKYVRAVATLRGWTWFED